MSKEFKFSEEVHKEFYATFQENVMKFLQSTDLTPEEMRQALEEAVENYGA